MEERGFRFGVGRRTFAHPGAAPHAAPGDGELPKRYYDVMDPFVTLTAAAGATKSSR